MLCPRKKKPISPLQGSAGLGRSAQFHYKSEVSLGRSAARSGPDSLAGEPLSLVARAIRRGGSAASRGVGVRRGQSAQKGGSTTRAIGITPPTNSGRGPRPLEAAMNRRGLLTLTTIVAHLGKNSLRRRARARKRSGRHSTMPNTPRDARPSPNRSRDGAGEARPPIGSNRASP